MLERTSLHGEHLSLGASMVDFGGWEMPIRYGSIPEEHLKVRHCAGLFDLGHMGRLEVVGPGAVEWVQRVITNDYEALRPGGARYTLILNQEGGVIDDAIVYRLPDRVLLIVNASNRERVVAWMREHRGTSEADLVDRTHEVGMVAIQGPQAARILPAVLGAARGALHADWASMKYYSIASAEALGKPALVARTGYTGEDGFEVLLDAGLLPELWRLTLEVGGDRIAPIGLGARDTLRLEAGMPLYGHELDESTTPWEAGLDFAVKLEKRDGFVGRDALLRLRDEGPARRLKGFRLESRRVARQGMPILEGAAGDRVVGKITSGAPSPTLGCPIAMGYVDSAALTSLSAPAPTARERVSAERPGGAGAAGGGEADAGGLFVDIRGNRERLVVESLPFFSRTRKKAP